MDNITISHFENDAIQEKKLETYGEAFLAEIAAFQEKG